jgi:hypothetical protein
MCIDESFKCNNQDNCGDNSDEDECSNTGPCVFGACSQICTVKKSHNFTCQCAPGFSLGWDKSKTCTAEGRILRIFWICHLLTFFFAGQAAYLMVASDSELRKINPYKGSDVDQFLEKSLSAFKIESVDILFFSHESINVFWTDHHNKIIQSLALPTKNRVKREGPKNIVSFFAN